MKLYTKTVCPKCMLVKSLLDSLDVDYEIINIDKDEESKSILVNEGYMSVPVLQHNKKFYAGTPEISEMISELEK